MVSFCLYKIYLCDSHAAALICSTGKDLHLKYFGLSFLIFIKSQKLLLNLGGFFLNVLFALEGNLNLGAKRMWQSPFISPISSKNQQEN